MQIRIGAIVLAMMLTACEHPKAATETEKPMATTQKTSGSLVFGLGPGFELAPKGDYSARQKAGEVTITAKGENPTAGYEIKLVQSMLRIWPPQYLLARKHPPADAAVAQVITPFEVTASFKSDDPVKTVIVSDAAGRHEVSVEQAGN